MCDKHFKKDIPVSTRKGGRLEDGKAHAIDHEEWTRRAFLRTLGFGVASSAFMFGSTPVNALGSSAILAPLLGADTDRVLVLVQLDGGNDGLNTVVPVNNDIYYRRRPNLAIPGNNTFRLSDELGLNNDLSSWQSSWGDGQLAVVQGVGYPEPNLSHFRSTDIWMSGSDSSVNDRSGWSGRFLEASNPDFFSAPPTNPLAVQMGGSSFIFNGRNYDMGMSIANTELFERLADGGAAYALDGLPTTKAGQEMRFARQVVNNSFRYAEAIQGASQSTTNSVPYPDGELGENLANVARLIKGGLNTCVYLVSLGGFDTHSDQADLHTYLLSHLGASVSAFMADLDASGMRDRALVMTFSEFGRTIGENGSAGTDHSTTAPMFLMGSGVLGGLYGNAPDLANTDFNDDPVFTVDFRSVYASVLHGWFGLDSSTLESVMGGQFDILPLIQGAGPVSVDRAASPTAFTLEGNYPNPFQGRTQIRFTLPAEMDVRLDVFDAQGRKVRSVLNGRLSSGRHEAIFDASSLAKGTYFYRLVANGSVQTGSMVVV